VTVEMLVVENFLHSRMSDRLPRSLLLKNVLADLVVGYQPSVDCFSECCWQVNVELMQLPDSAYFTGKSHLFLNEVKIIVKLVVLIRADGLKVRDGEDKKFFVLDCLAEIVFE